jgi:hypothetical protein
MHESAPLQNAERFFCTKLIRNPGTQELRSASALMFDIRFPLSDVGFQKSDQQSSREPHPTRTVNTAMDQAQPIKGKILRGPEGIGTVTPQMIEERARELARSDGHAQPNDLDRNRAREDLTGKTSGSEKPSTIEEPGSDWYTPRVSSGEKAPTVRPEDDPNIPEKLIQEGVEEADHDQRKARRRK